ncbi:MAG: hypothetical protein DLM61_03165 [Pseudonocardiales bacterium]|nr:MAG: hypothetical protein DLM61_03165 [Pseudonocardiales bacterium]
MRSGINQAVGATLRDAGYDLVGYRFVVLVEGFQGDGSPIFTALAESADAELSTADLIRHFADSDLAELP